MARAVKFFMAPEDEKQFLRDLAPFGLELYPRIVDLGYESPKVDDPLAGTLTEELYIHGAPSIGDVQIDKVKRGPDKGRWKILEVTSPVIQWERSVADEDGVLRSGRLWAELRISGDTQHRVQKSVEFEKLFARIEEQVKRRARKSDPVGYFVYPSAARLHKAGTELREAGRKGAPVRPSR